MPTVRLIIKGNVQGVFFRAAAREMAEKTEITGWVRNTSEGDVEIMATGTERQLDLFIDWCHHGPPKATVSEVIADHEEERSFDKFRVVR